MYYTVYGVILELLTSAVIRGTIYITSDVACKTSLEGVWVHFLTYRLEFPSKLMYETYLAIFGLAPYCLLTCREN